MIREEDEFNSQCEGFYDNKYEFDLARFD
jgi:hypothetical protein